MRLTRTHAVVAASLLVLASCDALSGGGDEDPPDPPANTQPPAPPPPAEDTAQNGSNDDAPQAGGLQIPGLDGLQLPLPVPDEGSDPEPPARNTLGPPPPGSYDPSGHLLRPWMEAEAERVHQALVAALPEHERTQTQSIPFEVFTADSEPNAAAGCTRATRSPVMMITSAMLVLAAGIAETKAYDELAGTTTFDSYVTAVIDQVRNERPVAGVDPSLHVAPNATDPHKLARQASLFDMQVAFIVGHELAHHYRGHTTCVEGRTPEQIQQDEAMRALSQTVPPFEQPREVEADMWGVTNVLEAGHRMSAGRWTQEGALLNLDFFGRLANEGGPNLVLAFLSTHPPSFVRMPVVRSTSQQWEPGRSPPAMPTPGNLQLPGGLQLPANLPTNLPFPLPLPRGN
jgi:hypothetical protein